MLQCKTKQTKNNHTPCSEEVNRRAEMPEHCRTISLLEWSAGISWWCHFKPMGCKGAYSGKSVVSCLAEGTACAKGPGGSLP